MSTVILFNLLFFSDYLKKRRLVKKRNDAMQTDLKRYFDHLNERKLSQVTIKNYFMDLRYLITFLSSQKVKDFNKVTSNDFKLFNEYLNQKKLSNELIKQILSKCKHFLRFIGIDHVFPKKQPFSCESHFLPILKDYGNYFLCERGYSKNGWDAYQREINRFLIYMALNKWGVGRNGFLCKALHNCSIAP